jgi:translation initiation factor IF-3
MNYYRINHNIKSSPIRLIDEDAKQIGIMSIQEALQKAHEESLDLVEIAPKAKPPVVKLIEFSKFKYQEAKKLKAEKKGQKGGELKEIQMSLTIGKNDYNVRVNRAQKFLSTGNKVKLSIKFQGRENINKQPGYDLIEKFKQDISEVGLPETEPRVVGKKIFIIFTFIKKKNK